MMTALILCLVACYFVPSIVALVRHHRQRMPIILLNLLLGWTLLGWVAALVWAATRPADAGTNLQA